LRVIGGNEAGRVMFGPGEPIVINAGTTQGIQKGQQYFVRRYVRDHFTPESADFVPHGVHTAGWITIVDARADKAVATVTHACDGILVGDYLEPYAEPVATPPASLGGAPDFDHPARLVMGDEKRQTGAAGSLMLMNRGSDHEVRAGQTITIYRETTGSAAYHQMSTDSGKKKESTGPVLEVGRGTVLNVRPQTSLIRIDWSRQAVFVGDLVAVHRITP